MEFMSLHVVLLVVNPISIMVAFPILTLGWDRPLLAVPGATAAALIAMEAYYLLMGVPVAVPNIGVRVILMLATCALLWAANAAAKRVLIARRGEANRTAQA